MHCNPADIVFSDMRMPEIKEKSWRNVFMLPPVPPMPKLLRSPQSNSEIYPRKFRCGIPLKPVTLETPEFRSAEIDMAAAQEQKFCRMSLMRAGIASATLMTGAVPWEERRLYTSSNLRYLSPVVVTSVPPVSACLRRISRLILPA